MTIEPQKLGKKGEELAKEYYQNNHYTILESNWRSCHLEIDLIAINQEYIVFCEVKTRSSSNFGKPEQFVTLQKQKNLI
ncbi:MAG: YraN family protein, partial [Bacteroidales bacterium]